MLSLPDQSLIGMLKRIYSCPSSQSLKHLFATPDTIDGLEPKYHYFLNFHQKDITLVRIEFIDMEESVHELHSIAMEFKLILNIKPTHSLSIRVYFSYGMAICVCVVCGSLVVSVSVGYSRSFRDILIAQQLKISFTR